MGGLYGVRIERLFAGESMFHRATDASKVALVHLVDWLATTGAELLDVQWTTPHLESLGAIDISRDEYLTRLASAVENADELPGAELGSEKVYPVPVGRHPPAPRSCRPFVPGAGRRVPATEIRSCAGVGRTHWSSAVANEQT